MKIFISGPMTGYPNHNREAFEECAKYLSGNGHEVVSPHLNTVPGWLPPERAYNALLSKSLGQIDGCQGLALLPGWERSFGAALEAGKARRLGLLMWEYNPTKGRGYRLLPLRDEEPLPVVHRRPVFPAAVAVESAAIEPIEAEARRLVSGVRNGQYGGPEDNFRRIGQKWGATLDIWRHSEEAAIPPALVALLMVDLKTTREAFKPQRDNRVDAIGYLLCADMVTA